jgi:ATP-dependent DNA ligase
LTCDPADFAWLFSFVVLIRESLMKADTTWIEPRFDAEIAYAEFTDDRMVRHPSFKRLVENQR